MLIYLSVEIKLRTNRDYGIKIRDGKKDFVFNHFSSNNKLCCIQFFSGVNVFSYYVFFKEELKDIE